MATLNRPGAPDAHICGIDTAMEVIGGKWKVLILWALDEHPHLRFGELRRLLPGITEKVLTSHLREMEADGVVRRVSYDEVPPRVEYSLTEDGTRLNEALEPLAAWGRQRPRSGGAAGTNGAGVPLGDDNGSPEHLRTDS
ncbi:helix-turn-helix transcriptional regulator [Micromonospora sp. LAH09]|uniref:winged helix-turn-helix transcriptional regulator n=1 Tax=Micromonospora cabrerizensis TaxID=2911213 RepID=UPI001EE7C2AB|nr:helix-turn-helix domain-containing protein [Micromonospora cabrerizensis]MCG5472082.1 helix-turn-helix transcriptional regulator [Micromonospora cabrerizensis]